MSYTRWYASVNIHRLGLEDLEVEVRNSYNEVVSTKASLVEILTNPESLIQDEEGPDRFSLWHEGTMICRMSKHSDGGFSLRVEPCIGLEVALGWYMLQLRESVIPESFDLQERARSLLIVARFGGTDQMGYDLWFAAVQHAMKVTGLVFVYLLPAGSCLWSCAHREVSGKDVPRPGFDIPNIKRSAAVKGFMRMVFKYFVTRYVKREKVLTSQPIRLETKPFRHGERA